MKYWGKKPDQLPVNPSVSMTLSHARTTTRIHFFKRDELARIRFFLDGIRNERFESRIEGYFLRMEREMPLLKGYSARIESSNTFPHSTGIASSASAFGAMGLGLADFSRHLGCLTGDFFQISSEWARLGSGSAARSVLGPWALWGQTDHYPEGSDRFAVPLKQGSVHPLFSGLRDAILLVDEGKKSVSSSEGHRTMEAHPYAQGRIAQANNNLYLLLQALEKGRWKEFSEVVENEALSLHALMMSATPWFVLLKPATLIILDELRDWRKKEDRMVAFTLDAGPNPHLLYPEGDAEAVETGFLPHLQAQGLIGKFIADRAGTGPVRDDFTMGTSARLSE